MRSFGYALIIISRVCFSSADEISELREPGFNTELSAFNDQGNGGPNNAGIESFNDHVDVDRLFGAQGVILDEVVRSNAAANETPDQKKVRALVADHKKFLAAATAEEKRVARAFSPDTSECTFGGDSNIYTADYCNTIVDATTPFTKDFVVVTTIGKVEITGDTAVVYVRSHAIGTVPILGWEVNTVKKAEVIAVKKDDGEWYLSRFNYCIGDNADSSTMQFRSALKAMMRDFVYSTKQHYPAYNTFVIVGGSAAVGFFSIGLAILWILRKRRIYKKVCTVSDV